MSTIEKITEILGTAPAQLTRAVELGDGGVEVPFKHREGNNRIFEERELGRSFNKLIDHGWTIAQGPAPFGKQYNSLIVRPPAPEGIDTATLPLRDRIRVETGTSRKGSSDFLDKLEINEDTGELTFDTRGPIKHGSRETEEVVGKLKDLGWQGATGRQFGYPGIYGTFTPPATGLKVSQARVDALLGTVAR